MNKQKLIPLTQSELTKIRKKQYQKQKGICGILKIPIKESECVIDHKHKLKSEECGGPDGLGCLRGVVHRNANTFEGKVVKLYKRYGLSKQIDLSSLLRNVADYIEKPLMEPKYIHPNEREKRKKLNKTDYKRICKFYFVMFPRKRILPKYPKSGLINNTIEGLLSGANILNCRKLKDFTIKEKELIKKAQIMIKEKEK